MPKAARLTPMLRQYLEVKERHPDALLLYRMGDFYELFFEDAVTAAPILEVTLTARQRGTESEAPMCGVPHHALEVYLGKLVRAGRKVAICDQVEDPATARGLVKREVTRVVTPGTVSETGLLESKEDNLLASLAWDGDRGAGAFLDVSTGKFQVSRWGGADEAVEELALLQPREVVHPEGELPAPIEGWIAAQGVCRTSGPPDRWSDPRKAADSLQRQLGTATLRGFGLEPGEPAVRAAATALGYARETQRSDLAHLRQLTVRETSDRLVLDATTLTNLEVFGSLREGGRRGTLIEVLDQTVTPAGGRLLREWLRRPLREGPRIEARLEAVEELTGAAARRQRLRELLGGIGDPERLLSRAVLGSLAPREAAALRDALDRVPRLLAELSEARAPLLVEIGAVDPRPALAAELERTLDPRPAATLAEGGVIRAGVDPELDRVRSLARDSKRHVLALEAAERERTGIASLKIRYNKVFGYYLEVTKANQDLVPEEYVRKQTLVNAERYITPDLKELEEKILTAESEQIRLEEMLFAALRQSIVEQAVPLRALSAALARLDVLANFAEVAVRRSYVRPRIDAAGAPLVVRDGRHPVVERTSQEPFVPNDTELGTEGARIVILTGPNMGGKSTYLRQVALLVLMAQAGSFVPAAEASLGVADRIFTRVGASDDLSRGESTFMVEMIETAKILHRSTPQSLVVLDEVGRGTATFDGLSLAWAIVEHLHAHGCPKTLFATHYHELTELAAVLPQVVNWTMAVKEWEDRIVFLRRLRPGSSDKSYGIHVARLAGIPEPVVERAAEVLANLEAQEYDLRGRPRLARGRAGAEEAAAGPDQMQLFAPPEEMVAAVLREVDLERLSPLAALNLLESLKARLDG